MEQNRTRRSLRAFILGAIGIAFICFIMLFMLIFWGNMSNMLSRAEEQHMTELTTTVEGALKSTLGNLRSNTRTWSSWDEVYEYALGNNPEFIAMNLADGSMLTLYKVDYVIIKDADGNDIYTGAKSAGDDGIRPEVPAGLSEHLKDICAEVVKNQSEGDNDAYYSYDGPYSDTGFVTNDGKSYLACTMPILHSTEEGPCVGSFSFVAGFDHEQFKELTKLEGSSFKIMEQDPENPLTGTTFEIVDQKTIKMLTTLENLIGDRSVVFELQLDRHLYSNGLALIIMTTVALFCAILLIMLLLYIFMDRFLMRPMARLISDVGSIDQTRSIDTRSYEQYQELHTLSTAINSTLVRLDQTYRLAEQSNVSLNVLTNILNGLDAYLYVSDPETDEILFINDHMKDHFNIEGSGIGSICWKVLQSGFVERCEFCPCFKLEEDPGGTVVWEEHNTVTNHYYRNTDILIDWIGGKKAHLQHSVDITDIKLAEIALKKRLEQQALMTDISQNFLDGEDIDVQIDRALKITGEFMGADRALLNLYQPNPHSYSCVNEWINPDSGMKPRLGNSFNLDEKEYPVIEDLMSKKISYIDFDEMKERLGRHFEGDGSFLVTPIFVDNTLWGVLNISKPAGRDSWSQSDINLTKLVSSLLSGVLNRRKMEAQLRRLSSIVQNSPQFISYLTSQGKIFYMNHAVSDITGYSEDELFEGGLELIYDEDTMRRVIEEYIPATIENGEISFEAELIRKDGEKRIMAFSSFITDSRADNVGNIATDITAIRMLESELIAAKESAEQGSRSKGEFLSRMSHEMRTPMNTIIGMTNIAKSSSDQAKKEYCLDKIDGASRHLLGVINDILDMSKIEADKFELSYSDFNFDRMIMNVINVTNFRMEEKHQNFSVYIDPGMPDSLITDEQRLAQVITNLLTNAIKFTPEDGNIGLNVSITDETDSQIEIRVEVSDTGIGISPEQISKLFRSFEQADGSIARKFGGTGLGLAISKRIVEMMGGNIWVESEFGNGSTFIFTLKAKKGDSQSLDLLKTQIAQTGLNILAVDGSSDTGDYLRRVTQKLGAACQIANSAPEAREMIKAAPSPFDLIFVDWHTGEDNADDLELIRELKTQIGNHSIIVMVPIAQWSEIEKDATGAGADGFITKPLLPTLIADCINRHVGVESDGQPSADADSEYVFAGKVALLAEDVEINREIVITILDDTELEIDCAVNGLEAVNMFKANPGRYDIVFMDVHMPEVDGLEATRRIRALNCKEADTVPIIAMTANVFREDIEQCIKSGMDDHIGKPIDFSELLQKLEKYLK